MYFRSKRDLWYDGMTLVIILSTLVVNLWRFEWGSFVVTTGIAAMMGWIWLDTGYFFTDDALVVRCGPAKWTIPYDRIEALAKTRNPLKSPALSLQRLEVFYGPGGRSLLISPEREEEFLRILEERCPRITWRQDRIFGR